MVPLLENPQRQWKKAAFSQFPRSNAMGYSMRTDRYRYTEWRNLKSGEILGQEIYDHDHDPNENRNIAADGKNAKLAAKLSAMLARHKNI